MGIQKKFPKWLIMNNLTKLIIAFALFASSPSFSDEYKAKKALTAPVMDGKEDDVCWSTVPWAVIDQVWDPQNATAGTADDYTGHYKAVWTEDKLYVLMRVTDDKLVQWDPTHPLNNYWMSDCPEIFIDENRSKGNHQCNYNAFAYHISLLFDVVDSDVSCNPQLYKDVLTGQRTKVGNTYYWEFALKVYTDNYQLGASNNPKATLSEGKVMGWSIAYNDSDDQPAREKMYGSQVINLPDKNVSYINADYFGSMELVAADVPTSLATSEIANTISVYPNPAKVYVELESPDHTILSAKVIDYQGKEILHAYNTNRLDLHGIESGLYFLLLKTDSGTITKKLFVE